MNVHSEFSQENLSIRMHTFSDKRGKVIQPYYNVLEWCFTSSYELKHGVVKSQCYFYPCQQNFKSLLLIIYKHIKKANNGFQG